MLTITAAEAQALHSAAIARGAWTMWLVTLSKPDTPGKAVAWAIAADNSGGTWSPGLLVADTLEELRSMLPAGLTRHEPTSVLPAEVVEAWV
jgi:hypothetical protein